jgi:hypothetical protein
MRGSLLQFARGFEAITNLPIRTCSSPIIQWRSATLSLFILMRFFLLICGLIEITDNKSSLQFARDFKPDTVAKLLHTLEMPSCQQLPRVHKRQTRVSKVQQIYIC